MLCSDLPKITTTKLYLHGHKKGLQHYKSVLRIKKLVLKKIDEITIIKLTIINCLAFLNRMIRIVLIAC